MSFTATLNAGADLPADVLAAWINELRPLSGIVTVDQNLATSSTALQNVTSLVVPVAANHVYKVDLMTLATLSSGVAEDIDISFTFPAGATLSGGVDGGSITGIAGAFSTDVNYFGSSSWTSGSTRAAFGLSTSMTASYIRGTLTVGSTAGNLQVQASQHTSGANTVTVNIGSQLVLVMLS